MALQNIALILNEDSNEVLTLVGVYCPKLFYCLLWAKFNYNIELRLNTVLFCDGT
jgi:hypothetical protein